MTADVNIEDGAGLLLRSGLPRATVIQYGILAGVVMLRDLVLCDLTDAV